MPYSVDRKNKCIYKKKSDGSRGEKVGCTKGDIDDYLAALHIHADENKKIMKEGIEMQNTVPGALTTLYAVQKPYSGCELSSLVKPIDPLVGLGQDYEMQRDKIHAIYPDQDLANDVASDLYEDYKKQSYALEEKKDDVVNKVKKAIDVLEKKRKEHMDMAKEDPKSAGSHREKIAVIVNKIDDLMSKLEKIEKSKKDMEKEFKEKDKKEK